jgi:hypothetical protein
VAGSELAAHLRVCNIARRAAEVAECAFLRAGLNSGGGGGDDAGASSDEEDGEDGEAAAAELWRRREDDAAFPAARAAVRCVPSARFRTPILCCSVHVNSRSSSLRRARRSAVADAVLAAVALPSAAVPLPGPVPPPACVTAALAAAAAAAAAPHAVAPFCPRHGAQQAGILAHMASAALLPPAADVVYCELGAGRGYLSATLAESYDSGAAVLLVERRSYRYKAERQLRRLRAVTVARLRCDVAELDLRAAPLPPVPPAAAQAGAQASAAEPLLRRRRLVVTAKHLCGGGTDAALRCAARCAAGAVSDASTAAAAAPSLLGLAIAPCCHHACRWRVFCGKAALRAAGLGPAEFALATRMASWALDANAAALHAGAASVDAGDDAEGEDDHADAAPPAPAPAPAAAAAEDAAAAQRWGISSAERVAVGAAVKRLFDGARTHWATQRCGGGAAAALVRYCERHVSPENRLILLNTRAAAAAEG